MSKYFFLLHTYIWDNIFKLNKFHAIFLASLVNFSKSTIRITSEIAGLVQERHNSIANAMELRFSCTNPLR